MKKLIAMIASISVFACMSVSALAATPAGSNEDISYTAKNEAEGITSDSFTINATDVTTGNTQTTIVVIEGVGVDTEVDGKIVKTYNISTDTIQYINQSATPSFTLIPMSHNTYLESEEDVTLTVLVGGDKISRTELGTITYTAEASDPEFTYGDVDDNGTINATDASWVLSKFANSSTELPCGVDKAADVDGNGTINATDASWVLSKFANSSTVFPAEAQ